LRLLLHVLVAGVLAFGAACGSGAGDEPERTPAPVPTPADFNAIRSVDLQSLPDTQSLLQRLGSGRVATEAVLYEDLTGDMREEAVVPITSDGTLGNIAYLVYTMHGDDPQLILSRTMDLTTPSGLSMSIDDFGALVETAGVYGNEDPLCCPSQLRLTTFRWDGSALQVAGEQKQDNPNKAKQ
jgi:hypothetical protein